MYFLFLTLYVFDTILQIERWWRELHERLEKYFKDHLNWLKVRIYYGFIMDFYLLNCKKRNK